ncbi:hypothetical protein N8I77_010629 [Diaporthe amygdali]|uniref:BTB domain-containing protein n=1 Tax=Phomopsis amygdali TaxID=1214568 RepID=A0AAD9S7G1_PHOAM|nr:hypothetical protein N8I77_010629 [Diaporthe amygdali]
MTPFINTLFESAEFADCKVICNGREFSTHQLILSTRSQYFRKAFSGPWKESQTLVVNLDDHEPEKIEWLLRFIYHQDLKWHRDYAISKSRNGFLAMLVELTILGDYFLTQGLIDAASEAAVDVCSSFGVKCWALDFHDDIDDAGDLYFADTPTKSFKAFIHDLMEAIALTSKTSGPTCQFCGSCLGIRSIIVIFIRLGGSAEERERKLSTEALAA